jgi:hypothetical protein
MSAWNRDYARGAVFAARTDLGRRVASQVAVDLAIRRVRAACMSDCGYSLGEIAEALGVSARTARRDVSYVRDLDRRGIITRAVDLGYTPRIGDQSPIYPPVGAA